MQSTIPISSIQDVLSQVQFLFESRLLCYKTVLVKVIEGFHTNLGWKCRMQFYSHFANKNAHFIQHWIRVGCQKRFPAGSLFSSISVECDQTPNMVVQGIMSQAPL